jgi:Mn-dependent DtxR family transcriptional regulator
MATDSITFRTKKEADDVLEAINDILNNYEYIAVSDLKDLLGIPPKYTDSKLGWTSRAGINIRESGDTYILDVPKPMLLF